MHPSKCHWEGGKNAAGSNSLGKHKAAGSLGGRSKVSFGGGGGTPESAYWGHRREEGGLASVDAISLCHVVITEQGTWAYNAFKGGQ